MKPTEFKESNCIFAKDQAEYLPLPAYISNDGNVVISCWKMTWRESLIALIKGHVYVSQLSFGDPLQPQIVNITMPIDTTVKQNG